MRCNFLAKFHCKFGFVEIWLQRKEKVGNSFHERNIQLEEFITRTHTRFESKIFLGEGEAGCSKTRVILKKDFVRSVKKN